LGSLLSQGPEDARQYVHYIDACGLLLQRHMSAKEVEVIGAATIRSSQSCRRLNVRSGVILRSQRSSSECPLSEQLRTFGVNCTTLAKCDRKVMLGLRVNGRGISLSAIGSV